MLPILVRKTSEKAVMLEAYLTLQGFRRIEWRNGWVQWVSPNVEQRMWYVLVTDKHICYNPVNAEPLYYKPRPHSCYIHPDFLADVIMPLMLALQEEKG